MSPKMLLITPMINWLKQLFSSSNSQTISQDESSDRTLILETQLQQLKLELKEKENTIAVLNEL